MGGAHQDAPSVIQSSSSQSALTPETCWIKHSLLLLWLFTGRHSSWRKTLDSPLCSSSKCLVMGKCSWMVPRGDQSIRHSFRQWKMKLFELEWSEKKFIFLLPRLQFSRATHVSKSNVGWKHWPPRTRWLWICCSLGAPVWWRTTFISGAPSPSEGLTWWHIGKDSACQCRRCGFNLWVRKIPWRRKWQLTPVFLPGESPWTEEPGGLQSTGSKRVRHGWVTKQQQHNCPRHGPGLPGVTSCSKSPGGPGCCHSASAV